MNSVMRRNFFVFMLLLTFVPFLHANPDDGLAAWYSFDDPDDSVEVKDGSGHNRHGTTNASPDQDGLPCTQTSPVIPGGRFRFLNQKALPDRPMEVTLLGKNQEEIPLAAGTDYEVAGGQLRLLRQDIPQSSRLRYTYRYYNEGLLREPGVSGKSLRFDGINDWMDAPLPEPIDVSNGLTISLWIHPAGRRAPIENLFNVSGAWGLSFYENTLVFRYAGAFNGADSKSDRVNFKNFRRPLNEWTHLAVATNGNDVHLYVNGTEVDSALGALAGPKSDAAAGELRIGGGQSYNYNGMIDELRIYQRPLSSEDVAALAKPAQ